MKASNTRTGYLCSSVVPIFRILVGSAFGHDVTGSQVEVDVFAAIGVIAPDDLSLELAALDIGVIDVGDLQFAAGAWLERADDVEDAGIIEVDADDSQVARGIGGLLDDSR